MPGHADRSCATYWQAAYADHMLTMLKACQWLPRWRFRNAFPRQAYFVQTLTFFAKQLALTCFLQWRRLANAAALACISFKYTIDGSDCLRRVAIMCPFWFYGLWTTLLNYIIVNHFWVVKQVVPMPQLAVNVVLGST